MSRIGTLKQEWIASGRFAAIVFVLIVILGICDQLFWHSRFWSYYTLGTWHNCRSVTTLYPDRVSTKFVCAEGEVTLEQKP